MSIVQSKRTRFVAVSNDRDCSTSLFGMGKVSNCICVVAEALDESVTYDHRPVRLICRPK